MRMCINESRTQKLSVSRPANGELRCSGPTVMNKDNPSVYPYPLCVLRAQLNTTLDLTTNHYHGTPSDRTSHPNSWLYVYEGARNYWLYLIRIPLFGYPLIIPSYSSMAVGGDEVGCPRSNTMPPEQSQALLRRQNAQSAGHKKFQATTRRNPTNNGDYRMGGPHLTCRRACPSCNV
jgi:hypothetical protein